MKIGRLAVTGVAAALLGAMNVPYAHAATVPNQHVRRHLRVDGSSDLRGRVTARSGLRVTAGLTTDSLSVTGPTQLGGTLSVAGTVTSTGLNAGSGAIATTGSLQGGGLTVSGDGTFGGGITVSKRVNANGIDIGAGGLHVAGDVAVTGGVTTDNLAASGNLTATNGTFRSLTVSPGGSVNFNNAAITGVSGINLTGNANLTTLQINAPSNQTALTVTQNGKSVPIGVGTGGNLNVGGAGLTVQNDLAANAATFKTVSTPFISSGTSIVLDTPAVGTSHILNVGGNLTLLGSGHLIGNRDTRGTCTVNATSGTLNSCSVAFTTAYSSPPVVVVTPTGGAPGLVTNYSVTSGTGGLSIYFNVSQPAAVTFNYIVEQ